MALFLGGLAFLLFGYFAYGRVMDRILKPDDRAPPCQTHADGVDFVPLPTWKNLLVQLLDIAGVGPVIGVVLGIRFGKIALLIIPVGCVFLGAVHDYCVGLMSMRMGGANIMEMVSQTLGRRFGRFFSGFTGFLLLFAVTVFVNIPAGVAAEAWLPSASWFWPAVCVIFVYYMAATLFPVDKVIGRFYPFFGIVLIAGTLALAVAIAIAGFQSPEILRDCPAFAEFKAKNPIFPCLFVTIACGIVSGFHATQSPIVARTLRSERKARATFFGMMIAEGAIAMTWAAASLAVYNADPVLVGKTPASVLPVITHRFLGPWMGGVTVAAVVVLAVTSGDTALRAARLSVAEVFRIKQAAVVQRVCTSFPLIAVVTALLVWSNAAAQSFAAVWNYFAWSNQVIAATMLMASTVWLGQMGVSRIVRLTVALPAAFMTTVVASFILWAAPAKGQVCGLVWRPIGGALVNTGLPLDVSIAVGAAFAILCACLALRAGHRAA